MKIEWRQCFKIGVSAFILFLAIHYWSVGAGLLGAVAGGMAPLLSGCIMAYMINILMSFYERILSGRQQGEGVLKKGRNALCLCLALLTLVLFLGLIIGLVVPEFVACIMLFIEQLPGIWEEFTQFLEEFQGTPDNMLKLLEQFDVEANVERLVKLLMENAGGIASVALSSVSGIFSRMANMLIGFIFALYLLLSRDKLKGQMSRMIHHFLPERVEGKLLGTLSLLNKCFRQYIVGQVTEAVILGVICTLGMLVIRLPYATMIGAMVGVTALIPVVGAYLGAIVGAFMILTVSPMEAVIFLIYLVILQQIEGNLIYPKVVGSSLGLPGIWVLAAVTVGGGVLGVPGMLLGVPLAAFFYQLARGELHRRERLREEASRNSEEGMARGHEKQQDTDACGQD